MSKSAHVVDGEASESESEIETGKSPELQISFTSEPFVVAGEAPESDDESKLATAKSPAASETPQSTPTPPRKILKTNYNSLLHQKLWECNVSMRATVEGLLRYTTDISVEKLSRADRTLLSVQECMRATNSNLTLAKARLKQMHTSLNNANCSSALPTVKIRQSS